VGDIPKETLKDLKGLINVMTETSRQIEEKNCEDWMSEVRDYKRLVLQILILQFARHVVIITKCTQHLYTRKMNEVFQLLMQLGRTNSQNGILFKVFPNDKACVSTDCNSHSDRVERCKKAVEVMLPNHKLPNRWAPSYLAFFRTADRPLQVGNFHVPKYTFKNISNRSRHGELRSTNLR
jgi:hypothetical protein